MKLQHITFTGIDGKTDLGRLWEIQKEYPIAEFGVLVAKNWHGTVWMNPPYSRQPLRRFCEKMAAHGNGIALLVNRQDNLLWQEVIFPTAASMIFMRHRVKFIQPDGRSSSPFFGSCLVAWGRECDRRLRQSGIEGKYVVLNAHRS